MPCSAVCESIRSGSPDRANRFNSLSARGDFVVYKRIVVPVDGSDIAELAFPNALELARLLDLPLHLVRVADDLSMEALSVTGATHESFHVLDLVSQDTRLIEEYLQETANDLRTHHVEVTTEILCGAPQHALVEAMNPGDLYVMATHGRSGVARWYMGSVSEQVMRHATVPLLMIRAGSPGSLRSRLSGQHGAAAN